MLTLGIDWGGERHTAVLMSGPSQIVCQFQFDDNLDGFLHLLDVIRRHAANEPTQEIVFAIERKTLRLVDFLLANGFTGYCVEPNQMPAYRLRYRTSGARDDYFDAFVLSDVLWRDRDQLARIEPEPSQIRRLKLLLADREGFVRDRVSLANRLTAALCEYYPAMFDMFADVTGPTARALLLAYPTLAATQNLDRDTLKTFLVEHHSFTKRRLVHILEATTRPAVPVPAEIVEVKQQTVKRLVEQLQLVQKAIDEYDARIQELTAEHPEVKRWRKLPGVGLIVGSSLYTLFGEDRRRFANEHEVQAYVGISPRTIQSGNYRAVCFRHGCNQDYRQVMMHWALSSIRNAEWAKRYYGRKRAQGMKHYHALRCLGCVLLRIGFAMWKKDTTYDEELYLASMARHQIRNEPKVAKSG